jgi:hypothetical protein
VLHITGSFCNQTAQRFALARREGENMDELFKEAFARFVAQFAQGAYLMPPDNDFLFFKDHDFSKIDHHRSTVLEHPNDPPGLVGHRETETKRVRDGEFPCAVGLEYAIDFGDSAHKTGILAFCNSIRDQENLPVFEVKPGLMVRHPTQVPWNNPWNCTRDQLLAFSAGCWRAKQYDIVKRLLSQHYERPNPLGIPSCQNRERDCPGTGKGALEVDILDPTHLMFLRICSGKFDAYLDPLGQFMLQVAIEATEKDVSLEKNQLILQAIVCGRLDLYVLVHDNYKENLRYYWERQSQPQIGEAFIDLIEHELKRYSGQISPRTLGFPFETLKALFKLDFKALFQGDLKALEKYMEQIFAALGSDVQKVAKEVERYISDVFKNPLAALNIPFLPHNPVAGLLNSVFTKTDLSEVYYRLNEIQRGVLQIKSLCEKIIQDLANLPEQTAELVQKRLYHGEINTTISTFNAYSRGYAIELTKNGLDKARELYSKDLSDLCLEFTKSINRYFQVELQYTALPFVLNCMDMHLSCLTMAGKPPSLIIGVLTEPNSYRDWIRRVVNDGSASSLKGKLAELEEHQRGNILYFKQLYRLSFMLDGADGFDDIGKPTVPGEPNFYNLSGVVRKHDYSLIEVYDPKKIKSLEALLESGIISSNWYPRLVHAKVVKEAPFVLGGTSGGRQNGPEKFKVPFALDETETSYDINTLNIWSFCNHKLNYESDLYPKIDSVYFEAKQRALAVVGEDIFSYSMMLVKGQQALKQIDEIVDRCNQVLNLEAP